MYQYSVWLSELARSYQEILSFDAARYRYFVDSSPKGEECVYARLSHRNAHRLEEVEGLRAHLLRMRERIDHLLSTPLPPPPETM